MQDPRLKTLAKNLINYSVELKPGENVYIEIKGKETLALGKELVAEATKVGGNPIFIYNDSDILRRFLQAASEKQVLDIAAWHMELMKKCQAFIGVRGDDNSFDLSDVEKGIHKFYKEKFVKPVHLEQRVKHTKWCVLRYPNYSMATLAETAQEPFEDFYFKVCNLDYSKLSKAMDVLKAVMEKTDKVRIVSPGTDLTFSIKGIPSIKCDGKMNIPDGEVFTAPQKTSINGVIQYNTPSPRDGNLFNNVRLKFKDGKIVEKSCEGDKEKFEEHFAIDEGALYVGEFAVGVNPYVTKPMKDILFDEKIWGSIHLTPGACYDEAPNGNHSALHWDLVLIQTPEYGGGQLYFDNVLIRENGEFVHPELKKVFSRSCFNERS